MVILILVVGSIMIRKFIVSDLDTIMGIWLNSNIETHYFIPKSYWNRYFNIVKEILPKSEVYVFEKKNQVVAFVGIDNGHVLGIFVSENMRSKGIGELLIKKCKSLYKNLSLCVYKNNKRAIRFYEREGFIIKKTQTDRNTLETEYLMKWVE